MSARLTPVGMAVIGTTSRGTEGHHNSGVREDLALPIEDDTLALVDSEVTQQSDIPGTPRSATRVLEGVEKGCEDDGLECAGETG